jgi:hypothetical protein
MDTVYIYGYCVYIWILCIYMDSNISGLDRCHYRIRNCLPFRTTWFHPVLQWKIVAFRIMINNNESDFIIAKHISEVIRTRKSKKDRQLNDQMTKGQKDKHWLTNHYTEIKTSNNSNPILLNGPCNIEYPSIFMATS